MLYRMQMMIFLRERWGIHYCLFQGLITFTVQNLFIGLIPVCVSGFCYIFFCQQNYKLLKQLAFSLCESTYKLQPSHFSGFSLKYSVSSSCISLINITHAPSETLLHFVQFHTLNLKVSEYYMYVSFWFLILPDLCSTEKFIFFNVLLLCLYKWIMRTQSMAKDRLKISYETST